jgi:hypothetical protein
MAILMFVDGCSLPPPASSLPPPLIFHLSFAIKVKMPVAKRKFKPIKLFQYHIDRLHICSRIMPKSVIRAKTCDDKNPRIRRGKDE